MTAALPEIHDPDRPVRLSLPEAFTDTGAPRSGPKAVFFVRKDLDEVPTLVSVEPNTDLWDFADDEATPAAPRAHAPDAGGHDDADDLEDFFTRERHVPAESGGPTGTWPTHNYGTAYENLRQARSVSWTRKIEEARQRTRRPAELWEVEEIVPPTQAAPTEPPAVAAPPPFAVVDTTAVATGDDWLAALSDETARVASLENRLMRTLHGDTVVPAPLPVFDTTDVLFARRDMSTIPTAVLPEEPSFWGSLAGLFGSGVLVLLVLMFLQLVFF